MMTYSQYNTDDLIEVDAKVPAKKSIIWLHGLGADGRDFVPFIPELKLPNSFGIRFIFPHAPMIPITINNGFRMRAWYDISSILLTESIDEKGIHQSIDMIDQLIAREESRGIETKNIMLGGFSQGCVIALATAILHQKTLAGVIGLSGYLPLAEAIVAKSKDANKAVPIFLGHGTHDPIVPYALGKSAFIHLKNEGYNVSWHSYPMAHTVVPQEIIDIQQWIQKIWVA